MNKKLLLFLVLTSVSTLFAQERSLKAYLDNKQFFAPGVGNYIEFHLQFDATSLNYLGKDDGLIGEVAVSMEIANDTGIVQSDAYRLSTPFMKDSIVEDFYDVKRFKLDPGVYLFTISLMDVNSDNEPQKASMNLQIDDLADAVSISDLEIAELAAEGDPNSVFYKSGYNIIPRLSTFYPEQLTTLPVYFEIYNTNMLDDSVFAIRQTVIDAKTGAEIDDLTMYTRHEAAPVVPILRTVPIEKVRSGKYLLNFTLINRNMTELATQSYEFERSNDEALALTSEEVVLDPAFQESISSDSVAYYLESLIPISKAGDVRKIIDIYKEKNEERARKYIQLYWSYTTPANPYEGWIQYKKQVQLVERLYANNFQEGFETDRGRVYLQYGAPTNIISKEVSDYEYPYEIWQYNKIGRFSNKRFVFYNPDLVNNTYRLLHSDMVGEQKNPMWQRELVKRNTTNGNIDNPNAGVQDRWGGNSSDHYRQY